MSNKKELEVSNIFLKNMSNIFKQCEFQVNVTS